MYSNEEGQQRGRMSPKPCEITSNGVRWLLFVASFACLSNCLCVIERRLCTNNSCLVLMVLNIVISSADFYNSSNHWEVTWLFLATTASAHDCHAVTVSLSCAFSTSNNLNDS